MFLQNEVALKKNRETYLMQYFQCRFWRFFRDRTLSICVQYGQEEIHTYMKKHLQQIRNYLEVSFLKPKYTLSQFQKKINNRKEGCQVMYESLVNRGQESKNKSITKCTEI